MLNIYGHFFSMPTNKVRLCVSFLKLPHEYHHIDLGKREQNEDAFRAINPAGRVPAMEDDGFLLNQSDAICKYLCAIAGPSSFYPDGIQEQAKTNEWIDYASQHIMSGMARIVFNRVFAKMQGSTSDENSIKFGLSVLARDLPNFDDVLASSDYLMGDKISLADITLIAALEPAEIAKVDLSANKNILRWRETIMAREFYKRVHEHFAAEMKSA